MRGQTGQEVASERSDGSGSGQWEVRRARKWSVRGQTGQEVASERSDGSGSGQ